MKPGIRNLAMLPLALVFAATVGAASPPTSHSASKKARVSPSSSMLLSSLAAPNLGSAGSFAVLAASTVTNTGWSAISGDLGLSPGTSVTGFPPGMLAGTQYIADPASAQAQLDLTAAYNDAATRTVGAITLAGNLGGMTLAPGLYKSTSSLEISSGDLTLDAKGDASAVYIFQMGSTLVTTVGRKVILAGGAQAANIYWQVGSSATLGVSSVFKGTIMAMASITATTGASVEGHLAGGQLGDTGRELSVQGQHPGHGIDHGDHRRLGGRPSARSDRRGDAGLERAPDSRRRRIPADLSGSRRDVGGSCVQLPPRMPMSAGAELNATCLPRPSAKLHSRGDETLPGPGLRD